MADTHINAYFMAVDEAKQAVIRANAELDNAQKALETKKKEVDWQEPVEEKEESDSTSNNPFKKK